MYALSLCLLLQKYNIIVGLTDNITSTCYDLSFIKKRMYVLYTCLLHAAGAARAEEKIVNIKNSNHDIRMR